MLWTDEGRCSGWLFLGWFILMTVTLTTMLILEIIIIFHSPWYKREQTILDVLFYSSNKLKCLLWYKSIHWADAGADHFLVWHTSFLLEDVILSILLFPKPFQSPKFNLCLSFWHHKYQAANDGRACLLLLYYCTTGTYPLHVHNKNLAGVFTVWFESSYLTLLVNKVAIHYWIKRYWLCLLYNRIAYHHCVAGLCSAAHHLCL